MIRIKFPQILKVIRKYRFILWAAGVLLATGLALGIIFMNLQALERNRITEYKSLSDKISRTAMNYIFYKQYDNLQDLMDLLANMSTIQFIGLYIGQERTSWAGELKYIEPALQVAPLQADEQSVHKWLGKYLVVNTALPFHPDVLREPGTLQIVYALQPFFSLKNSILFAVVVILVLVTGLIYSFSKLNRQHEALLKTQQMLRKAEETKAGMISGLTHHAIKFLTVVQGQITKNQIKLRTTKTIDPRELKKDLQVAGQSIDSLNRLIENLNDHERLQKGEVRMLPEPISLRERIQEAIRSLEEMAGRRGILIEYANIYGAMEITSDSHVIQQVLINVLQNAVQYSPAQGLVKVWQVEDPDSLTIYISDQGPGIALEAWQNIFEPFTRLIPEIKGTGLGLSNSRQLIRLIGGELGVQASNIGQGTTFFIKIPLQASVPGGPK